MVPAFLGGINLPLEAQGHRLAGVSSLLHGASSNSTFFFLKVTGRGENPPPEFHSFNIVADHELQKKLLTRRSKYFSNTGENEGEETQHDAG